MKVIVKSGDVLDEAVDVLICPANVQLNMSGGVNGALLLRGGQQIQEELHDHLRQSGRTWIAPGSVVRSSPGPVKVKAILHSVAIDAFYGSSVELLQTTLENALREAALLAAATVALPALATGYGPLSLRDFAIALRQASRRDFTPVAEVRVVLRREVDVETVRAILADESQRDSG